jgi:hypothetical protein
MTDRERWRGAGRGCRAGHRGTDGVAPTPAEVKSSFGSPAAGSHARSFKALRSAAVSPLVVYRKVSVGFRSRRKPAANHGATRALGNRPKQRRRQRRRRQAVTRECRAADGPGCSRVVSVGTWESPRLQGVGGRGWAYVASSSRCLSAVVGQALEMRPPGRGQARRFTAARSSSVAARRRRAR